MFVYNERSPCSKYVQVATVKVRQATLTVPYLTYWVSISAMLLLAQLVSKDCFRKSL